MAENSAIVNLQSTTVGFIGGGNMAQAIGAGLIRKGVLVANNVWISGRTTRTFSFWKNLGSHTTQDNLEVVLNSEVVFICVKPQMLDTMLAGINQSLSMKLPQKLFISVLVGVDLETLTSKLSKFFQNPQVVRSMPSTPLMVGEGITVYCGNGLPSRVESLVNSLLSPLGVCESVPENLMNPIGALSGSGPAYGYLIIEALADGAVRMGVPRAMATKFASQVLIGSGRMVQETEQHPGQLKDEVCSPGGTTITGIHALERGGVRAALMNAIEAAVNRSNELSAQSRK